MDITKLDKIYLYHITDIGNIPSMIEQGGLLCDNEIVHRRIKIHSAAYEEIKERRRHWLVEVCNGGTLADYVPMFFASRPPMLNVLRSGRVPAFTKQEDEIVHLVSSVEVIVKNDLRFCFTDGHAAMYPTSYYTRLEDLSHVDWEVMSVRFWASTDDDPSRQQRREAEFLIWKFLPWRCILKIGCKTASVAMRLNDILKGQTQRPKINTEKYWYYGS